MWLINVDTRQLEEFIGLEIQRYAILSHTWVGGQEVTFQEMRSCGGQSPPASLPRKSGWQKIDWTCRQAERDGLDYAWVDTCCIDKSSSAELSEAINSMFRWYERAAVCYALLADLEPAPPERLLEGALEASIRHCRWFTRSWTLQELIAPRHIKFYGRGWRFCFTKETASAALARITGIGVDILEHTRDLSAVSVAQKMSWAASRRSTRIEDAAYSLLGIFGINMPLLYGEEERAFLRLQVEIISSCPDHTILAWTLPSRGSEQTPTDPAYLFSGVMASSPMLFRGSGETQMLLDQSSFDFSMANRGIKLRAKFRLREEVGTRGSYLVLPVCRFQNVIYGIKMRNVGGGCFVRQNPGTLVRLKPRDAFHQLMFDPFLLTRLPASRTAATGARNLILESRQRVLEIVLPPGMEVYRRWPWQQWDEVDTLFFGEEAPSEDIGWAALKICTAPPPLPAGTDAPYSVDFLFYAFGWTRGPELGHEIRPEPRCTIHRVYGAVQDRAMEQMNDEAVRDGWNAYWLANRLVKNSIPERSVLVVGTFGQETLLLTSTLQVANDKSICARPFWRVTFVWKLIPGNHAPPVLDRGWREVDWGTIWNAPWDRT